MKTSQDIRNLLAAKFKAESSRLASWGTKTDEKAAISFADAVTEFVRALCAESRYRELKRVMKKGLHHKKEGWGPVMDYLQERLHATKIMAKAIEKFAIDKESKRTWQYTSLRKDKKKKHRHHTHGSKHE